MLKVSSTCQWWMGHSKNRDLEELPSEQEVLKVIGKLRSGTAAGSSGILPEMVTSQVG